MKRIENDHRHVAVFDIRNHLPVNAEVLKQFPGCGYVARIPLLRPGVISTGLMVVDEYITELYSNRVARVRLRSLLNLNSRESHWWWLGKASSSFIAHCGDSPGRGEMVLDVFVEDWDNNRKGNTSNLHNYIREATSDYEEYKPLIKKNNLPDCVVLSGHIAPLLISTPRIAHVLMLDAYQEVDCFSSMCEAERGIVRKLWGNRIMPVTGKGYPIGPAMGIVSDEEEDQQNCWLEHES